MVQQQQQSRSSRRDSKRRPATPTATPNASSNGKVDCMVGTVGGGEEREEDGKMAWEE